MINKQNLWFVTLFSLIIILGVYYVSMGDESLKVLSNIAEDKKTVEIKNSDVLVALKVKEDEDVLKEMEDYKNTLLNVTSTIEEKNDAYIALQLINSKKGEALKLEKIIKNKFNFDSFIKINKDTINITIANKDHSPKVANGIMREIQKQYQTKKYITIKFE